MTTYSEMEFIAETNLFHVNNVELYSYLEQARMEWYKFCKLIGYDSVLVNVTTSFKKEVFNEQRLFIRTWIERVGDTSFTLQQTIVNERNELVVSAEVVVITIARQTREKTRVPQEIRSLLEKDTMLEIVSADILKQKV